MAVATAVGRRAAVHGGLNDSAFALSVRVRMPEP